jgi:hypothetical protein
MNPQFCMIKYTGLNINMAVTTAQKIIKKNTRNPNQTQGTYELDFIYTTILPHLLFIYANHVSWNLLHGVRETKVCIVNSNCLLLLNMVGTYEL